MALRTTEPASATQPSGAGWPGREVLLSLLLYGAVWGVCLATFAAGSDLPGDYASDTNRTAIPLRAYVSRMLGNWNFPDLAPGMFFGQPTLTYGQVSLLYPTNLIGYLTPLSHHSFFLADLWLHLTAASTACSLLLRGRGASLPVALAGGWLYANSSAVLFRSWGHWTLLHQTALIPLALIAWERLGDRRKGFAAALGLGAVVGLMILSHNPQWTYMLFLLLLPLEIERAWSTRRRVSIPRWIGLYAVCGISAVLLGAAVLIPLLCGFRNSFRTILGGPELARSYDLTPGNLITMLLPYSLFGDTPGQFRGRWFPIESVAIAGRGALIAAIAGASALMAGHRGRLRRHALPLWLILGSLFLGTAPSMPWFDWVVSYVPLYASFRGWGRVSIFLTLGVLMLTATGLEALTRPTGRSRKTAWTASLCAAALCTVCLGLALRIENSPSTLTGLFLDRGRISGAAIAALSETVSLSLLRDGAWYGGWTTAGLAAAFMLSERKLRALRWAAVALLCCEATMFQRFTFRERALLFTPASVPALSDWLRREQAATKPSPYTTAFRPVELSNFALHFGGVRSTSGSDSNMRKSWATWVNAVQGFAPESYQLESHMASLPDEFVRAAGLRSSVDRAPQSSGRRDNKTYGLYDVTELPERLPYAEIVDTNGAAAGDSESVIVNVWNEDAATLSVTTETSARIRVREFPSDRWRVAVNGRRVATEADGPYLSVRLPPGQNVVELKYVDLPARIGAAVSLAAWALAGVTAAAAWRRNRRRDRIPAPGDAAVMASASPRPEEAS